MSDAGLRGVVVAHGALARGLVSAVERIMGSGDDVLLPLSNEGLGPQGICDEIDRLLDDGPGVIFTDLREGSCGLGARRVCMGRSDRLLVSGVNLPMLLDFVMKRGLPLAELGERLVERGRAAVASYTEQT